ncbi:MAG TPA: acyl-CoA dehydrogenase [Acidimicrobiales bacterium]|nr:acyl-CoA dehydrogenase [Acidimicrobiales bacterium]
MSLALTDEHQALAASARRFLETNCPPAVARAALDAEREELPPFWGAMAEMGWLGLHLDSGYGGQGYGLEEVAVVLEELGRVGAPGPFLTNVAVSALIQLGGDEGLRKEWLPGLADGSRVAGLAFAPGGPVLSGALADVIATPTAGGWRVYAVEAGQAEERPSLDPTRKVARISILDDAGGRALRIDGATANAVLATLVAAECAGGAAWCVETAAEYAKVRRQFGRPIGQFQAVKHRCANMMIGLEQIRAAAWDAAAAVSQDPDGAAAHLSAAVAGSVAPAEFMSIAKDCVQVLGGIGFTWEHDAHRYLRRATSLVALTDRPSVWHRRTVEKAIEGVRRGGGSDLLAGRDPELRERIRSEVEHIASLPREERRAALVDAGLFVPHWPEPWGRGAGAVEQLIIDDELERAGVRRSNLAVGAWAAPTIAAHGTAAQQERWVGPTLLGQIKWCQLFSEPGAGSDLASLTTRATRAVGPNNEDGWQLNGQKVWTSMAKDADYGICLARTNPDAPKHLGITYFIVDMKSAGIDIRPLRELTGAAMFNEVFLDDVFVPDDNVIGDIDGGWPLARTTLANERVAMGSGASFGGGIETLLALVASLGVDSLDPVDVDRLGGLLGEAHCLSVMGRRTAHRAVTGARPGAESSVRKLLGAEHDQRTQEFGLALLGGEGAATDGPGGQWTFGFLANRCLTIAGGTSEVQRNVIAERLLGLPRDPEPAT